MSLPAIMSGVQLTGHGGPDKLVWNDAIPMPAPGPGQILVKVLAAGVNNTDINTRIGWYSGEVTGATDAVDPDAGIEAGGWDGGLHFPRIQGGDLCGRVVAHGAGVDAAALPLEARVVCQNCQPIPTADNPVKLKVIGSEFDGAFAQYCVIDADQAYDVTTSPLSDTELGGMPCAWGTASGLLDRARVASGDRVLVTGASGGVGMAAVTLAAHLGARVTAQTSPAKADAVRTAGAQAILARDEAPATDAFDAVIDVVGGDGWPALIDGLRPGGRLAISGAIAGPMVQVDLRRIYLRDISIMGSTFQPREVFAGLVDLMNAGAVRPLVSKTYPLRDIAAAQADFATKSFPGKLVLIP